MSRIAIMEAYPFHPRNIGNAFNQLGQFHLPIQIHAIVSQVLRDKLEFFHPLSDQRTDLPLQFVHRARLVSSGNDGNRAIRAGTITPLAYFQIRIMARRRQDSFVGQFSMVRFP